jgi:hypothetical protein
LMIMVPLEFYGEQCYWLHPEEIRVRIEKQL